MNRLMTAFILWITLVLVLWGCTPSGGKSRHTREIQPIRKEMERGDREREWALVYFQSWRQHRDGDYLVLSRTHMSSAVKRWFDLQVKIGHSFPDFYDIDRRRRRGCLFLAELHRLALKFRVPVLEQGPAGCFKPI